MLYLGIDQHARQITIFLRDEHGDVLQARQVSTQPEKKDQTLWYRRTIEAPAGWKGRSVLLNFGAVDWEATVFVNGKEVGSYHGGSDPFSFDITGALKDNKGELVVRVWDPTDTGHNPEASR